MDPVEINAGTWYLRALRADDRIDDRPALAEALRDPAIGRHPHRPDPGGPDAHLARRAREWAHDHGCSWAVCEPTTGEMLAEVALTGLDLEAGTADLGCWVLARARRHGLATAAVGAVTRFGLGGLGLHRVGFTWTDGDTASALVAHRCGFAVESAPEDVVVAARRATDR